MTLTIPEHETAMRTRRDEITAIPTALEAMTTKAAATMAEFKKRPTQAGLPREIEARRIYREHLEMLEEYTPERVQRLQDASNEDYCITHKDDIKASLVAALSVKKDMLPGVVEKTLATVLEFTRKARAATPEARQAILVERDAKEQAVENLETAIAYAANAINYYHANPSYTNYGAAAGAIAVITIKEKDK